MRALLPLPFTPMLLLPVAAAAAHCCRDTRLRVITSLAAPLLRRYARCLRYADAAPLLLLYYIVTVIVLHSVTQLLYCWRGVTGYHIRLMILRYMLPLLLLMMITRYARADVVEDG